MLRKSYAFRWFPQTERSRAVAIAMGGFTSGNAIGLVLSPILMSQAGIFGPFVIFGLSGFLWVLVWLSATSSTPDRHPQISKYELEYILSKKQTSLVMENKPKTPTVIPPFRRLLSKMPTWSIIIANAMHSWVIHKPLSLDFLNIMFFNNVFYMNQIYYFGTIVPKASSYFCVHLLTICSPYSLKEKKMIAVTISCLFLVKLNLL